MKRKDKAAAGMLAGVEAGHAQARLDKAAAGTFQDVALVPLSAVKERAGGIDTREPTPEDVDARADSLEALGLLEPLVVDCRGRLLAGKTRLLALRKLAETNPDRWHKVPVRRMDFDAEADPARALAVEVAENEQRKDYTPAEVRRLAGRLTDAGFSSTPGRPRKGRKALLPALGAVVGKSKRQLLRILNPEDAADRDDQKDLLRAGAALRRKCLAFERVAAEVAVTDQTALQRRAVRDAAALAVLLAEMIEDAEA